MENKENIYKTSDDDNLDTFGSLRAIIFVRWITLFFGVFLLFSNEDPNYVKENYLAIALIILLNIFRSFSPINVTKNTNLIY